MVVSFQLKTKAAPCHNREQKSGYECKGALGCSAVSVSRTQYAESLTALLIALREFHFECIEEHLDEQNELRARGTNMTELPTRGTSAAANFISFLFISQNGGNICLRKPHRSFWFGRGIRATPLGSTFEGETFRPDILARCRSRPKADRRCSSPATPWAFAELYRKTRRLEVLNAELERRVEERTAERDHPRSSSYETHARLCTPPRPATASSRCLYASRGDSVHATLRKPALSFCLRGSGRSQAPSKPEAPANNTGRRERHGAKRHKSRKRPYARFNVRQCKSVHTSTWVKEARVTTHPLIGRSCRIGPCRGPAIIP
jgi:hypothetical protein